MHKDILVLIYPNTENNINVIKKLFECYESKKTVNILGVEYIVATYEQAIRKAGCNDVQIKFFLESLKDHIKNNTEWNIPTKEDLVEEFKGKTREDFVKLYNGSWDK